MADEKVTALLAATVTDILMICHIPEASVGGIAVAVGSQWLVKRVDDALDILRAQLRKVRKVLSEKQAEEFASMLERYLRNAREGAGKRNLLLMARVMAGMIEKDAIYADSFLRDANVLADLTGREIVLLGTIWRMTEGDGRPRNVGRNARAASDHLVPSLFATDRELVEALAGLTRTGLVMPLTHEPGHMSYRTTAAFERLMSLAPFEGMDATNDDWRFPLAEAAT